MFFSILGASLLAIIAVFNVLIIIGLPLGEFTLGGKYKVLPLKMRVLSGISILIQLLAMVSILQVGEMISEVISMSVAKGICIVFAIYLVLNTIMNFFSHSKKEKYVMTPLALISSVCFFCTFFGVCI